MYIFQLFRSVNLLHTFSNIALIGLTKKTNLAKGRYNQGEFSLKGWSNRHLLNDMYSDVIRTDGGQYSDQSTKANLQNSHSSCGVDGDKGRWYNSGYDDVRGP